ncbi:ROK family protein [Marinobacter nauticus]|uniref:ROK family protein n=1 Tax=Marinobacter nauticus TaxID=2743 RepID=UPI001D184ACB|nr:ROK family protein [Marinobacter nauticus]MCC4269399.1 ROK family protein [Marinobacter nauticus]
MGSNWLIGIDLGGTKTEVILMDRQSQEHYRQRVPTSVGNYQATLQTILALVQKAEAHAGTTGIPVGIGIPGSVSGKTGCIKNANSTWLNGQLLTGPNGVAGEWCHNPLPCTPEADLQQRSCFCGRYGCNETFLSGTGLSLTHKLRTGQQLPAHTIVENARNGDPRATDTLKQYLEHLARGLAAVINVLDPDIIVLGGGMSNAEQIYRELPGRLSSYVFGGECDTSIVKAAHGDSSGVRGAAWLTSPF